MCFSGRQRGPGGRARLCARQSAIRESARNPAIDNPAYHCRRGRIGLGLAWASRRRLESETPSASVARHEACD
eukprot:7519722-Alexandrium_andersonii.AAC.1